MGIIFYQIGIFVVIQVSSFYGRKARNVAIILIAIFTLLQVFAIWLIILQFITILLSYWVSEGILKNNKKDKLIEKDNLKISINQITEKTENLHTQEFIQNIYLNFLSENYNEAAKLIYKLILDLTNNKRYINHDDSLKIFLILLLSNYKEKKHTQIRNFTDKDVYYRLFKINDKKNLLNFISESLLNNKNNHFEISEGLKKFNLTYKENEIIRDIFLNNYSN